MDGWFIHRWRNSGSLTGKAPTNETSSTVSRPAFQPSSRKNTSPKYSSGRMRTSRRPLLAGTTKTSSGPCSLPRARMGRGPSMFSSGLRNSRAKRTSSRGEAPSSVNTFSSLLP
ncbi:MAG: hypothetical protein MZV64_43825 [Ignavibacteriales bacterium]|nr:hypothetical protein [Ignavibacteriales bacterium]